MQCFDMPFVTTSKHGEEVIRVRVVATQQLPDRDLYFLVPLTTSPIRLFNCPDAPHRFPARL